MHSRRTFRTIARLGFPLCGWLSLALFVFVASGLPIPVPYAKDLSRAFPCMFSQCGCRNADQCWRSCCCHSARYRLAWAKSHDIRPPTLLVAAADAEVRAMAHGETSRDSHCATPTNACCHMGKDRDSSGAASGAADASDGSGWISLLAATKCRGAHDFLAGVAICLPPPRTNWMPLPMALGTASSFLPTLASCLKSPPVPPPRLGTC